MATLKDKYVNEVVPKLREKLGMTNRLRLPRLVKVVVNMGIGVAEKDALKTPVDELAAVTGQRPVVTRAKKSISSFKLRKGMSIGAKVTLRGDRMYEFLDRLINSRSTRIRCSKRWLSISSSFFSAASEIFSSIFCRYAANRIDFKAFKKLSAVCLEGLSGTSSISSCARNDCSASPAKRRCNAS